VPLLLALFVLTGCSLDSSAVPVGTRLDSSADTRVDSGTDSAPPMDSTVDTRLDTAADDTGPMDTGPLPRPTEPFGAPTMIEELADAADDDDPSLTEDRLLIIFNSNRGGNYDFWMSERASVTDRWGTPELVEELNTVYSETNPAISPDGLVLYFASDRPGGLGSVDVYRASRAGRGDSWSDITHVPELSTVFWDSEMVPVPSGLITTLGSDRLGGRNMFESRRAATTDPWGAPVELSLNSIRRERGPFFEADALAVWFDSDQPGGAGGFDIYLAFRPDLDSPFGAAESVAELNSGFTETDVWVSSDLRHIVFSSSRSGNNEIWEATR